MTTLGLMEGAKFRIGSDSIIMQTRPRIEMKLYVSHICIKEFIYVLIRCVADKVAFV